MNRREEKRRENTAAIIKQIREERKENMTKTVETDTKHWR
jgi:hypothetical protein